MRLKRPEDFRERQEALLHGYECAEAFRNRKRRSFWFYFLIFLAGLSAPVVVLWFYPGGTYGLWWCPAILISSILGAYYTRIHAAPFCPNCKHNIVLTPAVHCHICGQPLKQMRCERCGVDQSWAFFFGLAHLEANGHRIRHCPACGVWLDTRCYRWFGGGRDLR